MNQDPKTLDELLVEFEAEVSALAQQRYPVRSEHVLKDAAARAWLLAETLAGFKEDARTKCDEGAANILLSAQCFASALASEIEMWTELRTGDASEAWAKLIDSQEYISVAERAHSTSGTVEMTERLQLLERTLFPPVVYLSPSFSFRPGRCTICNARFDQCPHEEDVVYLGRLCREIERTDMRAIEVSLIDKPRDKRCRLATKESADATHRDWFSGEIVNVESESNESGRTFNAVIYSAYRLRGI